MRVVKAARGGTTTYEFVPMPEADVRQRIEAEAEHHGPCYGLQWIDNVDVTGLLDTVEDLRRDNDALQAELTRARGLLDRHGLEALERGAIGDDPARAE